MIFRGEFKDSYKITWTLNDHCNFQCEYCMQWHNKSPLSAIDIDKLSASLNNLPPGYIFQLTGGEPFLERNFVEICQTITKSHYISINTNLSLPNVFNFGETIDPKKCLFLNTAVHIIERERIDPKLASYLEKVLFLQKKDFNVISSYVAHPSLFNRIEKDITFLKENGVKHVQIKIFRGRFKGRLYPESFSLEQKSFLGKFPTTYPELEILNKPHNYFGQLCRAGQISFVMSRNGDLRRCSSLHKHYGNLFNNTIKYDIYPKPCPIRKCNCPYEGIRNVNNDKGSLYSLMREVPSEKFAKIQGVLTNPNLEKKIKRKLMELYNRT